jgi:hypothetical protein
LLAMRRGGVPMADLIEEVHTVTARLEHAIHSSDPDRSAIHAFLRAHTSAPGPATANQAGIG